VFELYVNGFFCWIVGSSCWRIVWCVEDTGK